MEKMVRILAVLATILSVGLLGLGASPAQATHILCGDTVGPGSVIMDGDIGPCTGDGITLAAGTLLFMQGNIITGPSSCSPSSGTGVGIRISSDSVITNGGRVEKFREGIVIDGYLINGHGDNVVEEVDVSRNCVNGIRLTHTTGNIIRWNTVFHTQTPPVACTGILLVGSHNNDINANTLSDNGEPAGGDAGIRLSSSDNNVVHENGILRSGGTGSNDAAIAVSGSGNDVHGNNIHLTPGNGVAIRNVGATNTYTHNKCESPQTSSSVTPPPPLCK